jgi:hypothetical protein
VEGCPETYRHDVSRHHIGAPVRVRLMRDGVAPPDPLHLVGHRRTFSSPWRRASS